VKPRREIRPPVGPLRCAELPPPNGSRESAIPWAIIAAVVASVMPPNARIRAVVEAGPSALNLWALEGRRDHFGSHRVR
jgi:hypothetical protein